MTAVTLNEAKEDLEHLIERVIADAEPAIVCTDSGERRPNVARRVQFMEGNAVLTC